MALSSRAHAFSVESLVGGSLKRKLEDTKDENVRDGLKHPESSRQREEEQSEEARGQRTQPRNCRGGDPGGFQVDLQGMELWKRFHEIGTEMIITKAGRRMFPAVRVKIKGLSAAKQYYIAMDIIPVDSKRYRYVYHSSQWMVAGNTEQSPLTPRLYVHPDSPASGESWMKQVVSFDRVKLTNNDMDEKGHIVLQSMHKYRPRIHVIVKEADEHISVNQTLPANGVHTFAFPETEFTTVTAYQNQQITRLKIDRNPFAKGFRDPGRNRVNLDRVMGSYPWRPVDCRPPLAFQNFHVQKPAVGYSDSLGSSCTGTSAPFGSVLSPPCSPPLFHVAAASLRMGCRDRELCSVDDPLCYRMGPARGLAPQRLTLPLCPRLRGANSPPADMLLAHRTPPLLFHLPSLSSLDALAAKDLQLPARGALSHVRMVHPDCSLAQDRPPHQAMYSPPARRPYTVHGWNLTGSPLKLMAHNTLPSPSAATLAVGKTFRDGKARPWPQTVNHCL
ncbi:T-box transcription factor TBX22-like [Scyliorhinus canicula]|uniref:T-box transcription factor TBX22-like n=1 Tax=Scyliorhinus canicula TaxID=7830 RepID=UPI0018F49D2E|nr:T-box transcription factor TBX22-like [Scyliorhinus canicula]